MILICNFMNLTSSKNWKTVKLSEITEPSKKQWKVGDGVFDYVGLEHINQGDLSLNGKGTSEKLESNKFFFEIGDVLFGKLRPYFRKVVRVDFEGVCSTDIWVFRAKEGYDQKFLFYFLANQNFVDNSSGASSGTRMPRADWGYLKNTKWKVPSIEEQEEIAAILGSLDDKIELLRAQNKTLESMAQALFKEWFVDFNFPGATGKMIDSELGQIPEGWKVGKLSDVCSKIASGGTPQTKENSYWNGDVNWFSTKELQDQFLMNSEKTISESGLENSSAKLFPEDTVIVAIYAAPTVGRLGILTKEASFNQAACGLIANDEFVSYEYIYLLLLLSRDTLNQMANGAAQQNLSVGTIRDFKILIPAKKITDDFRGVVRPIFKKIKTNTLEIQTLSRLRDELLNKIFNV